MNIYLVSTICPYLAPLFPKFIHHYYYNLNIKNFIIILNNLHPSNPHLKHTLSKFNINIALSWNYPFSENLKVIYERIAINKLSSPNDWILYADPDEFLFSLIPLHYITSYCSKYNINTIETNFFDRINLNSPFAPLSSSSTLNSQFPTACNISLSILNAWTKKIILAKQHIFVGPGHHITINPTSLSPNPYSPIPFNPFNLHLHHFKWSSLSLLKLPHLFNHPSLSHWTNELSISLKLLNKPIPPNLLNKITFYNLNYSLNI